jgi:hypothetical protein
MADQLCLQESEQRFQAAKGLPASLWKNLFYRKTSGALSIMMLVIMRYRIFGLG